VLVALTLRYGGKEVKLAQGGTLILTESDIDDSKITV
jgi:hypothetical protein